MGERPPKVLILTGTRGAGKSTVAALVGRQPRWRHLSEDDIWKERLGKNRGSFGSPEYRAKQKSVLSTVFAAIETAMIAGERVVIDATVHRGGRGPFGDFFGGT